MVFESINYKLGGTNEKVWQQTTNNYVSFNELGKDAVMKLINQVEE